VISGRFSAFQSRRTAPMLFTLALACGWATSATEPVPRHGPGIGEISIDNGVVIGNTERLDQKTHWIWTYSLESGAFRVHAHVPRSARVLPGSGADLLVWKETEPDGIALWPLPGRLFSQDVWMLTASADAPIPLPFLQIRINSSVEWLAWHVHKEQPARLGRTIVPGTNYLCERLWLRGERQVELWDLDRSRSLGRVPATVSPYQASSLLCEDPPVFLVRGHQGGRLGDAVELFRAEPFELLDHRSLGGDAYLLARSNESDQVVLIGRRPSSGCIWKWTVDYAIGANPAITAVTKTVLLDEDLAEERAELPTWRDGLLFWPRGEPWRLDVVDEESGETLTLPDTVLPRGGFDYAVDQCGKNVVTVVDPAEFRVWEVDFPKATLICEAKLLYDEETDILSLDVQRRD